MLEKPSTLSHRPLPSATSTQPTSYVVSSGRSRTKSRGGCGTCKARKVKCDETKPVCSRCLTTGRTCDGYGISGGGGNTYLQRYGRVSQSTQPPLSCVPLSKPLARSFLPDELRYLRLYKQYASWTSSGWFGYPFWHATVLPALVSEPAILHAVVALSAAHPWDLYPKQSPDARDRFIVKQYSKAICALQPLSSRYADSQDVAVVLVACILFTFLEYSRERYDIAETHLKNGIRLLGEGVPGIEKCIVRSLVALVTQRSLFGTYDDDDDNKNTDFVLFLNPSKDVLLPGAIFASPDDAKYALDIVLRRITYAEHLVQQTRTQHHTLSLQHEQASLTALLSSWHTTYLRTISHLKSSPTTPDSFAFGTHSAAPTSRAILSYTLLLLSHTLAHIKLSALLSPSESIYRTLTPSFLRILSLAANLYSAYRLAASIPQNVNLHGSVAESGFIAPLYYTGLKCRVARVRSYVCKFLSEIPHKECVWDSVLAANVVKGLMGLEDGGGQEEDKEEVELGEVPVLDKGEEEVLCKDEVVATWFRSVRIEMVPGEGTRAKVTCERLGRDGSVEFVEFMVDNK